MKKVLKLILVVLVLSALTVSAFADSATTKTVTNNSGAAELTKITTTAPADIKVEVVAPTAAAANESAAKSEAEKAGAEIKAILNSFDINLTKGTETIHSGATVDVTIDVPAEYAGMYLNIFETSEGKTTVAYSGKITGKTMTVSLKSFSTFTPVVTSAALKAANSPQTSQSVLPFALMAMALVSLAGFVFAAKRKFN